MLKITTTNGKRMVIKHHKYFSENDCCYVCDDCKRNVVRYWNMKKKIYSEVYINAEQMAALVLRDFKHKRDTLDEDLKGVIDAFTCEECSAKIPFAEEPCVPSEEDYDYAFGKSNPYDDDVISDRLAEDRARREADGY